MTTRVDHIEWSIVLTDHNDDISAVQPMRQILHEVNMQHIAVEVHSVLATTPVSISPISGLF